MACRAILHVVGKVYECGPTGEPNGEPPKAAKTEIVQIEGEDLDAAIKAMNERVDRLMRRLPPNQ